MWRMQLFRPPRDLLLDRLKGGDRRSIGQAEALVRLALSDPEKVAEFIDALFSPDALIAMRAADVCEKICRLRPDLVSPHASRLLRLAEQTGQQETKWHLAQMAPHINMPRAHQSRWIKVLRRWLADDESRIVRVSAFQALADLGRLSPAQLARMLRDASPAMRARARKIAAAIARAGNG
jgi:HEAT repeat protein